MNDASASDRTIVKLVKMLGYALAAGAAYMGIKELGGLRRYADMKRMAKHHDGANPGMLPQKDSPEYAQAPRRAKQHDADRGHQRA